MVFCRVSPSCGRRGDGVDGIIVEADDDEALTRALRRLYDDEALRARMGVSARQRAEEYSWDRYARAVWADYDQLAATGRS